MGRMAKMRAAKEEKRLAAKAAAAAADSEVEVGLSTKGMTQTL